MEKNESVPANVEAMFASLNNIENWLERKKTRSALVFLRDGDDYTFLLVNSKEVAQGIIFPLIEDPHAMIRFLSIADYVATCWEYKIDDPSYKHTYERIRRKEAKGVDPKKEDIRIFHFTNQLSDAIEDYISPDDIKIEIHPLKSKEETKQSNN